MAKLKIQIPDGHEIDLTNSDLLEGVVKFKPIEKKLPTKWEDLGYIDGYYIGSTSMVFDIDSDTARKSNRNTWPTEELAKASLALCQLVRFRDIYNEGWEPDWGCPLESKFSIKGNGYDLNYSIIVHGLTHSVLAFKDRKTANLFLETFKDLLEEAKPLL